MPEPDLIDLFVRPLTQEGIRYFVSGSVAAMLYGEPRVTLDIDFVVSLRPSDIAKLAQLYPSPAFYVPPAEVIAVEAARERHGHFNIIHSESGPVAARTLAAPGPLRAGTPRAPAAFSKHAL